MIGTSFLMITKDWYEEEGELYRELMFRNDVLKVHYEFKGKDLKVEYMLNGKKAYRATIDGDTYFVSVSELYDLLRFNTNKIYITKDKDKPFKTAKELYDKYGIADKVDCSLPFRKHYLYKVYVSGISDKVNGVYRYRTVVLEYVTDRMCEIYVESSYGDSLWFMNEDLKYTTPWDNYIKGSSFYNVKRNVIYSVCEDFKVDKDIFGE